jgi:hemoglobin
MGHVARRDHAGVHTEPGPPGDLASRTHIHDLVTSFYREVVFDDVLAPVFTEVAEVDWAEHIPTLIDYWCWILFGTSGYGGAVTKTHRHLHGLEPLRPEHCDRWYELWTKSIDTSWSGPNADRAKGHAASLMAGLAKHVFGFAWVPPAPGSAERPHDWAPAPGETRHRNRQ